MHASIREWPDRWEGCRKDLVTGKVLKKETPDSGDVMTDDSSVPTSQLIRTPWDDTSTNSIREVKAEDRTERTYEEFAKDLQRKAKNREKNKGEEKGVKYKGAPKEENEKYPTNSSKYIEGSKPKRTQTIKLEGR